MTEPEYKNKEWLYDQYINRHKSCSQIALNIPYSVTEVKSLLKKNGIELRQPFGRKKGEKIIPWNKKRNSPYPFTVNYRSAEVRKKKRELQRNRDLLTNEILKKENKKPVFHHIDHNKLNDDPDNLCWLNHSTHITAHKRRSEQDRILIINILKHNIKMIKKGEYDDCIHIRIL